MNITESVKKDRSSGLIFKTEISSLFIPYTHLQYIELVNDEKLHLVFYFLKHIVFMTAPMDILQYALEGCSKGEVSQIIFNDQVEIKIEERVG